MGEAISIGVAQCRFCGDPVSTDGFELVDVANSDDRAILCGPACVVSLLWFVYNRGTEDFEDKVTEAFARVIQRMIDSGKLDPGGQL